MFDLPDPSQWIKLPAVAAATGISRSTIYRLARDGKFRCGERIRLRTWYTIAGRITTWDEVRRVCLLLNLPRSQGPN